ncbi:hypothetical protein GGS26DRAFT_585954 [Hypomontagnella submonticulosa]|nr:hypothetical protein GGS26DRAFT_585954 [Hypomontagnella submonticulosa]
MSQHGFYFDPSGPVNFRAPWLTFSLGEFPIPKPRSKRTAQSPRRSPDPVEECDSRECLPSRKRRRLECERQHQDLRMWSSDDEDLNSPAIPEVRSDPEDQCGKEMHSHTISISEGMAAAKRLARAAITQTSPIEVTKPSFLGEGTRHPLGIKRFGGNINSVEIKNRKLLVELGISAPEPVSKRAGLLSDPETFFHITDGPDDQIIPESCPTTESITSMPPPSSFIPFNLD